MKLYHDNYYLQRILYALQLTIMIHSEGAQYDKVIDLYEIARPTHSVSDRPFCISISKHISARNKETKVHTDLDMTIRGLNIVATSG